MKCNTSKEINELRFLGHGLSGEYTMFGLKSVQEIYLGNDNLSDTFTVDNNLSGTFTVAGASPNLFHLNLSGNKLTGFVG